MMDLSELMQSLRKPMGLNKASLNCLCELIVSLVLFRTVNLPQLAAGMPGTSLLESKQRRLQRFLAKWPSKMDWLGPWLLNWFYSSDERISLTIDRTNWKIGKVHVNFLVVGVVYRRMAIPILFTLLGKAGNSNCKERQDLLLRVFKYIKPNRIKNILADREFVGEVWFKWLISQGISFKIRVKHNFITTNSRGLEVEVSWLFDQLRPGERLLLQGKRKLLGTSVYLTGSRLQSGKLMVVASPDDNGCAIELYCERWEIETFFQNLKSRGFNLEETHITRPERLCALFQVLMLASCWCVRTGEWAVDQGCTIKRKKHGRPGKSLFRHGLDWIRQAISRLFCGITDQEMISLWRLIEAPPLVAKL